MNKSDNIIKFINNFNQEKSMRDFYRYGFCYHFAIILKNVFPDGELYYTFDGHFITKIGNKYYDIDGEYKEYQDSEKWEIIKKTDKSHADRILKYCILKLD